MDTHLIDLLTGLLIQENGTDLQDEDVDRIAGNFINEEVQILFDSVQDLFEKYKSEFNQLEYYMKLSHDSKLRTKWVSDLQKEYQKQSHAKTLYEKMSWLSLLNMQLARGDYDFGLTPHKLTDNENDNSIFILLISNNQPLLEKMLKCQILHSTINSIQVAEYLKSPLVNILKKELEVV
jgi:hypothetical protein